MSSIGNPHRWRLDTGGGDGIETSDGLLVWQFRPPIYHLGFRKTGIQTRNDPCSDLVGLVTEDLHLIIFTYRHRKFRGECESFLKL